MAIVSGGLNMSHDLYVVLIKNTIVDTDSQNLSIWLEKVLTKITQQVKAVRDPTLPTLLVVERQCECIHINRAPHTQRVIRVWAIVLDV